MSVRLVPRAMCAAVDIEHGQMTTASGALLPLAGSAPRSSGANTCGRRAGALEERRRDRFATGSGKLELVRQHEDAAL